MGCAELDAQVARLRPRAHGFGHSHVDVDELVDGTRYVQRALGHPSDPVSSDALEGGPLLLWSCGDDPLAADSPVADVAARAEGELAASLVLDLVPEPAPDASVLGILLG